MRNKLLAGLHPLVITVTRDSQRIVASVDLIPPDSVIRMEGQHWNSESRI